LRYFLNKLKYKSNAYLKRYFPILTPINHRKNRESERCLEEEKGEKLESKEEFKNPNPLSIFKN
jgi:hypothetical protein